MKNKIILLSLLLAGASATFAQESSKQKYVSESFANNFFISIGGGVQMCTNPDNFDNGMVKAVTPQITLSVGKLITPVWAVRGQLTGWNTKLNTDYLVTPYESALGRNYYKYERKYITLNADGMVNLTNLIAGYKEDRKFEFLAFAGPTLTATKRWTSVHKKADLSGEIIHKTPSNSSFRWLVGGSVGLAGKYNINKYFAIDLEARGSVGPSVFSYADEFDAEGSLAVTAGVTYTFGGKKFKSCGMSNEAKEALNQQVNDAREANQVLQSELADTKNQLAQAQESPREIIKEVEVSVVGPYAIFFDINKAVINDRGLVNLKLAADRIKANPSKKYKIAGYADKTGSAAFNKKLTEKRAQAVYDALVKEGVSKDQLEVIGEGATDNMFGTNALNRVVILE